MGSAAACWLTAWMNAFRLCLISCVTVALSGCGRDAAPPSVSPSSAAATATQEQPVDKPTPWSTVLETTHRGESDDLLTAGLGLAGLQSATPPVVAEASSPSAEELRRRAFWTNWRGIADVAPGGGLGSLYGDLSPVPGREFHAFARLPGAKQPHRVLLQLPDAFDPAKPCLVVTASSGSRGIYGAISMAGGWGLPRGCAVAYTDKGAGTGYFDHDSQTGVALDGRRMPVGAGELEFQPRATKREGAGAVSFKHAHSQDNPEADWGRHVRQAAEFALAQLSQAYPQHAPFEFANTRILAVAVSNGGAAVLRAAADIEPWLDGVVAVAPNTYAPQAGDAAHTARAAYDYLTEAALLMPCALTSPQLGHLPLLSSALGALPEWQNACAEAHQLGLLTSDAMPGAADEALSVLRAGGWTDAALQAAALSTRFDLWRAVAAAYASAYLRTDVSAMPCGYAIVAAGEAAHAAMPTWWSDSSGIPPGVGVLLNDPAQSSRMAALACLRALWTTDSAESQTLRAAVADTAVGLPPVGLPVVVIHGLDDGLIPAAFSSAPYVAWAQSQQRDVQYWQVPHAQHFDAFLGLPDLAVRYLPLMPYAWRALDLLNADLDAGRTPSRTSLVIPAQSRGAESLTASHLGLPERLQ